MNDVTARLPYSQTDPVTMKIVIQGSARYITLTLRIDGFPDITTRASHITRNMVKNFLSRQSTFLVGGEICGDGIRRDNDRIVLGGFTVFTLTEQLTELVDGKLQKVLDDWKEELVY